MAKLPRKEVQSETQLLEVAQRVMSKDLIDAFETAADGFSPDRVVADPRLNARFVNECRRRGIAETVEHLNRSLLSARKRGLLSGRKRSKTTRFNNEPEYQFASEIAIRFLERRDQVSLDTIICDPKRAAEFDNLAAGIAPGFSVLQYRWAALNIRKSGNLSPEVLARVKPPINMLRFSVRDLDLDSVPLNQGIYLFFDAKQILYIGESENLRSRIKKHIEHSDNKGLARWLWEFGPDDLNIELQVLDPSTDTRARKAFETELIRSRQPVFNIKR